MTTYVIVQLKKDPATLMTLLSVVGPFPTLSAAVVVCTEMGGAAKGYYVRPVREP